MSSFCHNLSSHYAHLRTLTDEFTMTYERVRDAGDLTEVRRLKIGLEEARNALLEQLGIFVVPDARNPYHEALLDAGLDVGETREQQDMVVDIREEIQRQLAVYRELRHQSGSLVLQAWIDDIMQYGQNVGRHFDNKRFKIDARIKAGMIPIVMPSRGVQQRTWEVAMLNLRPGWIQNGIKQIIETPYIYSGYKSDDKMTNSGFLKHIPNHPYLLWVKPTQAPEADTLNKSYAQQRVHNTKLVQEHPDLYDETDMIPTEYGALQVVFISAIRARYQAMRGNTTEPNHILPLDSQTGTRFLSTDRFSRGCIPYGSFYFNLRQLRYALESESPNEHGGFRPVSRSRFFE